MYIQGLRKTHHQIGWLYFSDAFRLMILQYFSLILTVTPKGMAGFGALHLSSLLQILRCPAPLYISLTEISQSEARFSG